MFENYLKETYDEIASLDLNFEIEPYEVVKSVHQYRMYWKPEKINVVLLAESHVFTDELAFSHRHNFNALANYPQEYVRFVYCLSYGDSQSLTQNYLSRNSGTPQFWQLFNQSIGGNYRVTNNSNADDKRHEKISLLFDMVRRGVWLMDCSIVGVYTKGGSVIDYSEYNQILRISFEKFNLPVIKTINPTKIIVVGQRVYNLIKYALPKGISTDWIHQPNARVSHQMRRSLNSIGYVPPPSLAPCE